MQTAVDRAMEMMAIPMNQLPPLAVKFARRLCNEVGMCGETFVTAYAVYAQIVEGLPNNDSLYSAREQDRKWFMLNENNVST